MSIHVAMFFKCEYPGCESRTEELVAVEVQSHNTYVFVRDRPKPVAWRWGEFNDALGGTLMSALLCDKHPAPVKESARSAIGVGVGGVGEPRTTDYCVACGQSPDSGVHWQPTWSGGCSYVDPRTARPRIGPRCWTCLDDPRSELIDADGAACYRHCAACSEPCHRCGSREHASCGACWCVHEHEGISCLAHHASGGV